MNYEARAQVDPSLDRPLYRQLADLIRAQIRNGEFAPGQRLPAQKDYMREHYLSRVTVDRAMTVLRNEGLIVTDRRGSRVTNDALRVKAQKMTELIALIQQYPAEARRVLAAVEDGLTLGPAQIMPRELEWEC
jgi:DNA-binding GntR family transcriptional regulator